jgi:hypothetical protein
LLLTEDKKAFKKITQNNKNKVRFRLDNETNAANDSECEYIDNGELKQAEELDYCKSPILFAQKEDFLALISNNKYYNDQSLICSAENNNITQETTDKQIKENDLNKDTKDTKQSNFRALSSLNSNSSGLLNDEDSSSCILKVYLENQTVKSFKYDSNTCVRDVLNCLKEKLCIKYIEHFGLVLKLSTDTCISKFILVEETRQLCKIKDLVKGSLSSGHQQSFQCLFRLVFIPSNYENLMLNDECSFNYLYEQVKAFFFLYFFIFY